MRIRLVAAAALTLSSAPVVVAAAPAGHAAEACTPSVSVRKPSQDASGFVTFASPISLSARPRGSRSKYRDRDADDGWRMGAVTYPGGSTNTLFAGECLPDGQEHRWVAYATLKVDGVLIARTTNVYYKAAPVTSCGIWSPARPTT